MRIIRGRGRNIICGCGLSADVNLANAGNPQTQISNIRTPLKLQSPTCHDLRNNALTAPDIILYISGESKRLIFLVPIKYKLEHLYAFFMQHTAKYSVLAIGTRNRTHPPEMTTAAYVLYLVTKPDSVEL